MPDTEKKSRVNFPFRVLPETIDMIKSLAEHDNDRPPANYLEGLVKQAYEKTFGKKPKKKPNS